MALQNQLVFALLVLELCSNVLLIIPLPFTWRRAMFRAMATSTILAKVQYGLKITFIFVALLFADAVNQLIKIQKEGAANRNATGAAPDAHRQNDYRSRKFLSERNFYLCGFTLFLSLILSRTYSLVLELIKTQEDLAILKTKTASSGKAVDAKDSVAVKQLADLQLQYDELSVKYNAATGTVSNKRVD